MKHKPAKREPTKHKPAMLAYRSCSVALDMWQFKTSDEVRALVDHVHASRVTWVVHTVSDSIVMFLEFPDARSVEAFVASPGEAFKGLDIKRPPQSYLNHWTSQ